MAHGNDYSDSNEAQDKVSSIRQSVRDWYVNEEDADYDSAREFVEQTVDSMLAYDRAAWVIVHNFNLEYEDAEDDCRTLQQMANRIAYDFLVDEGMEEWDDIKAEMDGGDLFWCGDCGEWHEAEYRCDDCDDGICPKKVAALTGPDNATYCEDCAPDHRCDDCKKILPDADFNTDYGTVLCNACSQKRENE